MNGECLRSDCRYMHNMGQVICKFWLTHSCLAGDKCIFSHLPEDIVNQTMSQITLKSISVPAPQNEAESDERAFPALTKSTSSTADKMQSLKALSVGRKGRVPAPSLTIRIKEKSNEHRSERQNGRKSEVQNERQTARLASNSVKKSSGHKNRSPVIKH